MFKIIRRLKTRIEREAEKRAYLNSAEYLRKEASGGIGYVDPGVRHKLAACAEHIETQVKKNYG
jgi:hypothetical protein